MQSPDLVQQAIVDKLKASLALLAVTSDIREFSWKGRDFTWPNVRVQLGMQFARSDGNCRTTLSSQLFMARASSEKDSAIEALTIAGLINNALFGQQIWTPVRFTRIDSRGQTAPFQIDPGGWAVDSFFYAQLY